MVGAGEEEFRAVSIALAEEGFSTERLPSLSLKEIAERLGSEEIRVLIVDLDAVEADNRFFKAIKKRRPDVFVIGLSGRRFHPELEEAMSRYIDACLAKPVDGEELVFWVKSVSRN